MSDAQLIDPNAPGPDSNGVIQVDRPYANFPSADDMEIPEVRRLIAYVNAHIKQVRNDFDFADSSLLQGIGEAIAEELGEIRKQIKAELATEVQKLRQNFAKARPVDAVQPDLESLVKALTAPKRLIFDDDGAPIGVASVGVGYDSEESTNG